MLSNPIIQSTLNQFNGKSFGDLVGFGMYSSPDNVFYIMLWNIGMIKFIFETMNGSLFHPNTLIVPIDFNRQQSLYDWF